MGKTAIVTGGTKKDVSAMGVLALNIKEIAPDLADELIIYHDGISKKEQKIIQNIFPTRFCEYQFPIDFISRRKNSSLRYFSSMRIRQGDLDRLRCPDTKESEGVIGK